MSDNSLPIGVFDSGVGGLTVLRALQTSLPQESFLYLGDTARLPYGTKTKETIVTYTQQAVQILLDRGIKMLVIACNTAATAGLPVLQETIKDIPILGVLEPGAQAASKSSRNGNILILATEATVSSQGYQRAIQRIRPNAQVMAQSCGLFVSLAEEGWTHGPIVEAIVSRYLAPYMSGENGFDPDCLVLGCTHFPVLLPAIEKVAGNTRLIIDSAQTTAESVANCLRELNLQQEQYANQRTVFLVTDGTERFARVAENFLGSAVERSNVELVDVIKCAK